MLGGNIQPFNFPSNCGKYAAVVAMTFVLGEAPKTSVLVHPKLASMMAVLVRLF